ncbi:zinc ribbon domain-containing protein [Candidatus Leptofilum sp.]|uniref:zinc ribbon domain-containing protein n=1 Tax=Candidatus Leptofilum sp. TaxID=3241576 RepID=UPI003B595066
MATGSILLGIALLVLTGLFIARPFLRPQDEERELTAYQLLLEEKELLLDQIHALDFDHETGKIPTEVHEIQRTRLVEAATAVLKAIDEASGEAVPATAVTDSVDVDIEIEAAIARIRQQRRQKGAAPAPAVPATNGQTRFCPQCGTPTDLGDRFCANCGHNLTLKNSTQTA